MASKLLHSLRAPAGRSPRRHSRPGLEELETRCLLSNYFVAMTGSDSNNGLSLDTPFQTIQHAADVAVAGDTVFIRGGTYRETVHPVNSGTAGAPITFMPYNNEQVTVSGADLLSGVQWSLDQGSKAKGKYQFTIGPRS